MLPSKMEEFMDDLCDNVFCSYCREDFELSSASLSCGRCGSNICDACIPLVYPNCGEVRAGLECKLCGHDENLYTHIVLESMKLSPNSKTFAHRVAIRIDEDDIVSSKKFFGTTIRFHLALHSNIMRNIEKSQNEATSAGETSSSNSSPLSDYGIIPVRLKRGCVRRVRKVIIEPVSSGSPTQEDAANSAMPPMWVDVNSEPEKDSPEQQESLLIHESKVVNSPHKVGSFVTSDQSMGGVSFANFDLMEDKMNAVYYRGRIFGAALNCAVIVICITFLVLAVVLSPKSNEINKNYDNLQF